MEIDKLFGLPAHPLLVHAPLVFAPVLLLCVVLLVLKPGLRERWGLPLVGFAIVLAGLCILAAGSGEKLERRVVETALVEEHTELGEQFRNIAIALAALTAAWIGALRYGAGRAWLQRLATPLAALVLLGAVTATVWDVRTGHAGAKAVWKEVGDQPAPVGGEGDGD